jgi:GNAT superfamily N-acetyltransferase
MELPDGYSDVPAGKIVSVDTCLEMLENPGARAERAAAPWKLRRVPHPEAGWYRELFARVGTEWLWFSRLAMPVMQLESIIRHPDVEVYALEVAGRDEGLLELDFREPGQCELAFFGLGSALLGQGAGRWLMNRAIEGAWARPIRRLWVHTCTNDHPAALAFYLRSGFSIYARQVEVADDPRLSGLAPRSAAPHVPIVEPRQRR